MTPLGVRSLTMSTTQSRLNFWHHLALKTRFAHARLKKGTVRFKTSNLASVYAAYEERGIAYVVLRWAAEVPMEQFEEAGYTKDVDHLIAAKDVMAALDVSSAYPGKIKCDYYSAEGRSGTSYNGMPYYQPALSLSILARRSRDPRGFYRPCLEDEFFAFAYHLCYHKGHRAGIPTGTDFAPDTGAPRDYLAELKRLVIKAQRKRSSRRHHAIGPASLSGTEQMGDALRPDAALARPSSFHGSPHPS